MKGYLVLHFTIEDADGFQKYKETAGPILKKYITEGKAKLIINSNVSSNLVEDRGKPHNILQVIEFTSLEIAKEFYDLPEYKDTIKYRTSSTMGWTALVEGFSSPPK